MVNVMELGRIDFKSTVAERDKGFGSDWKWQQNIRDKSIPSGAGGPTYISSYTIALTLPMESVLTRNFKQRCIVGEA